MDFIQKFIREDLFKSTDIASLVFFRICFGALAVWEVIRFFYHGWVEHLYAKAPFHFKYEYFTWVEAWPGNGMHIHFFVVGVAALFICIGFFYRISAIIFFLGYTYIFLVERALYNNHYYLICLLGFFLILMPLNQNFSLDTLIWPSIRKNYVSSFWVWIIRFQMSIVYIYGGFAKFDQDWLNGMAPHALIRIGAYETPIFSIIDNPIVYLFYAWSGLIFDLFIPFFLIYSRTRLYAFFAALIFHIHNIFIFNIGIFPYMAILLTLMFFPTDFPKRFLEFFRISTNQFEKTETPDHSNQPNSFIRSIVAVYFVWQLIFPFRHLLTPGWTAWHQEGHLFAWRMMLVQKNVQMLFEVKNPETGEIRYAPPEDYLNIPQKMKLARNPDMILQFSHHIKELIIKNAGFTPEILVTIKVGINGREFRDFLKPDLDLAKVKPFSPAYMWALPFE